jgi:hypothetical protein
MRDSTYASAIKKKVLLERCLDSKHSALTQTVLPFCKSQQALAAMAIPAEGIAATSLNSLKRAADLYIEDGGWGSLDSLRRTLVATVAQRSRRTARQDTAHQKAQDLRRLLEEADRARLRVERAYTELLRLARLHLAKDQQGLAAIARHQSIWGQRLGLAIVSTEKQDGT